MSWNTSETWAEIHTTTFINTEIEQLFNDVCNGKDGICERINRLEGQANKDRKYLQLKFRNSNTDMQVLFLSGISQDLETYSKVGTWAVNRIFFSTFITWLWQLITLEDKAIIAILIHRIQTQNIRWDEKGRKSEIEFRDYIYTPGEWFTKVWGSGPFISIEELINRDNLNPFIIDIHTLCKQIESTLTLLSSNDNLINAVFWIIDFKKLDIQVIIYLIQYLKEANQKEIKSFYESLQRVWKNNFHNYLITFLACSQSLELWNIIIELTSYEQSNKIFDAYTKLIELQSEVRWSDLSESTFLKVILQRWQQLIKDSLVSLQRWDNIQIEERYSPILVQSWAFIKAFIEKKKSWKTMTVEEFNENPFFEIQTFPWGNIFKDDIDPKTLDVIDLMSDAPYKNPKIFWGRDYKMLYQNIYETYAGEDNGAVWVNIQGIIADLCNPNVTFYKMMEKGQDTKWPVSICKIKKTWNNSIYYGSHYTSEAYQGDFGIWSVLSHIAFSEHPDADIHALATVNNTALAYHINYEGFVGTELSNVAIQNPTGIPTKDSEIRTWALIQLEKKRDGPYATKNKNHYPDSRIIEATKGGNIDGYTVVCLDTSKANTKRYLDTIKNEFSQWKVITRFFYEMLWNMPDTTKTYIVFEPKK